MGDHGPDPGEISFSEVLYETPSNYAHIMNVAMDVPRHASETFGIRGHIPIVGTADTASFRSTLVPVGEGRHRLFLNAEIRAAIAKGPGDRVHMTIAFDPKDRMPDVPADLESALREGDAWEAWEALRPSRRKDTLVYLADARRPATRTKRIDQIVSAAKQEGSSRTS